MRKQISYEILYTDNDGIVKRLLNHEMTDPNLALELVNSFRQWRRSVRLVRITREEVGATGKISEPKA